jgi:hypothetical protein
MKVSVEVMHSDLTREWDCCGYCEVEIWVIILIASFTNRIWIYFNRERDGYWMWYDCTLCVLDYIYIYIYMTVWRWWWWRWHIHTNIYMYMCIYTHQVCTHICLHMYTYKKSGRILVRWRLRLKRNVFDIQFSQTLIQKDK